MKKGEGKTGALEGSIFIADIYIPVGVSYIYIHRTCVEITPLYIDLELHMHKLSSCI